MPEVRLSPWNLSSRSESRPPEWDLLEEPFQGPDLLYDDAFVEYPSFDESPTCAPSFCSSGCSIAFSFPFVRLCSISPYTLVRSQEGAWILFGDEAMRWLIFSVARRGWGGGRGRGGRGARGWRTRARLGSPRARSSLARAASGDGLWGVGVWGSALAALLALARASIEAACLVGAILGGKGANGAKAATCALGGGRPRTDELGHLMVLGLQLVLRRRKRLPPSRVSSPPPPPPFRYDPLRRNDFTNDMRTWYLRQIIACLPLCSFAHACEGRYLQAGTPEIAIATYARPCGIGRRNGMPWGRLIPRVGMLTTTGPLGTAQARQPSGGSYMIGT
uniref:Uncharacterized protein n=1 Tax=Ananas comosus var. bracteatus TaxID=296719 RepID=A0A6V7NXS8_ANACO|nr:unnamed protein product [Ananas comosus var. bracteatus]